MGDSRASRDRMWVTDENGEKIRVYATSVERLKHIARFKPVGRFEVPASWKVNDVRGLENLGLIRVKWLERGDVERVGAWDITDLTPRGREVIRAWDERAKEKESAD